MLKVGWSVVWKIKNVETTTLHSLALTYYFGSDSRHGNIGRVHGGRGFCCWGINGDFLVHHLRFSLQKIK